MRRKSFLVRPGRKSLDTSPSLPDEANGENNTKWEANNEIVPHTFGERLHVPHKKRHFLGTSQTRGEASEPPLNLEACFVCDISDNSVSRCAGIDCFLSFHGECVSADDNSGSATTYCPYCWYKILVLKSKPLRDKVVVGEKAMLKYCDKEMTSDGENGIQDKVSDQSRGENTRLADQPEDVVGEGEASDGEDGIQDKVSEQSRGENTRLSDQLVDVVGEGETLDDQVRVARENLQNEPAQDQTNINRGAGKGHVPTFSWEEHDQVQQKEKRISSSRRRLILNEADSEISSTESTNEQNGEDVSEQITSSAQVITKVTKSKTVRPFSFFDKDKRRRLLWTAEEEAMLKMGVEKFVAEANKNMPWRKVLEMGAKVFHETRTPADLKDKWRNMSKKMTL